MSALGQKQTLHRSNGMSAFPKSGHGKALSQCPLSAKSRHAGLEKWAVVQVPLARQGRILRGAFDDT
jgi:hypothetical protein